MKVEARRGPLKVLYVWDSEYPWDIRVEKTCRALTAAGMDVHVVARNRAWQQISEQLPEAIVHRMPPWKFAGKRLDATLSFPAFFNPRWSALIARTLDTHDIDAVIVRDLPLCPTAIRHARRRDIPVILDLAEHYPAMMRALWQTGRNRWFDRVIRNPRLVEAVERYCVRHADHVLTVADEMTSRLRSMGVPAERVTRVANTPELTASPPMRVDRADGGIQLVYLGLLEVVRGLNDVIDAIALLPPELNVSALIIGAGRDTHLFRERAARAALLDRRVFFTGHLPHAQAMARVAAADIGVLPLHRNEHMDTTVPNKLFDYMSVGLPVITSDTRPSARIVREENAGEVFIAGDSASLSRAILALADPAVRREKGERGRAAVHARFRWDHDARQLVDAVRGVVLAKQAETAARVGAHLPAEA